MKFLVPAVLGGIAMAVSPALAKQIGSFKDWTAHVEGNGKSRTCWIYNEPVKDEGKYATKTPTSKANAKP